MRRPQSTFATWMASDGGWRPSGSDVAPTSPAPVFVTSQEAPSTDTGPLRWGAAPLRRRVVAWIIDVLLAASIGFVVCMPTWQIYDGAGPFSDQAGWTALVTDRSSTNDLLITALETTIIGVVWAIYLGWSSTREGEFRGQTFGKQWLGIRTLAADGAPLSDRAAWRRAGWFGVVLFVPSVVGVLLDAALRTAPDLSNGSDALEFLVMAGMLALVLRSPTGRGPHDRFAATTVVCAEPLGVAGESSGSGAPVLLPIEARRATATSWILAGLAFLVIASGAGSALFPAAFGGS